MVAYVLDPTTGRDGFFYWHEGKIGLCPSFGLVGASSNMPSDKLRMKSHKPRFKTPKMPKTPLRFDWRNWIIAALVLGVLYFAFAGSPFTRLSKHEKIAAPPVVVTKELPRSTEQIYIIGRRDNPWSICNRVYNNGDLSRALMRYNGLSDVTGLQVGQQIKLPPKETLRKLRKG